MAAQADSLPYKIPPHRSVDPVWIGLQSMTPSDFAALYSQVCSEQARRQAERPSRRG